LFKKIEPLLAAFVPSAKGGRPRVNGEMALNGILFVLRTGIPWEELSQEPGFGSGMTCWRRLRQWQDAGWGMAPTAHAAAGRTAQRRVVGLQPGLPGRVQRAQPPGGSHTGPNPTDRGKLGSKRHLILARSVICIRSLMQFCWQR